MGHIEAPERKSRKKLWIALIVLAVVVVVVVLATTLSLLLGDSSTSGIDTSDADKGPSWHGWNRITHLAAFGDSQTSTKFDVDGDQPSVDNPIGNPAFPGSTSSVGPNWIGYMTATYNSSFIKTIDLGGGGATIDGDILRSKFPFMRSFEDQVLKDWIPNYAKTTPSEFQWSADDTLFAIYFGLNDARGAFFKSWTSLNRNIDRYVALMGNLYDNGARNFLVLKLPPFQRAPMLDEYDADRKRDMENLIKGFNTNLTQALLQFSNDHSGASLFMFDTHKLFNNLLDDPCSYKETCPIQDTTTYCPAYELEREDPERDDPSCAYPLDQYFWLNAIHCGWRVHNVLAKSIVAYLSDLSVAR